jgi:hypothetical protein
MGRRVGPVTTDTQAPVFDDELSLLAVKHGTDKAFDHWYTPHYQRRFVSMRHLPVKLLEIGVGGYTDPTMGGESLRMWREYFDNPDSVIVGLDIHVKDRDLAPGCYIEKGNQTDPRVLDHLNDLYGPFDIVVDDGSHQPDDILQSWVVLWNHLSPGGWYCIEDLQTSYWAPFGGSSVRTGDSVIGFLQGLIDRIHYADFDVPGYTPNRFDLTVVGLEIARNIAFILKGDNSKPSEWMPDHPHGRVFTDDGNIQPEWAEKFPLVSDVYGP